MCVVVVHCAVNVAMKLGTVTLTRRRVVSAAKVSVPLSTYATASHFVVASYGTEVVVCSCFRLQCMRGCDIYNKYTYIIHSHHKTTHLHQYPSVACLSWCNEHKYSSNWKGKIRLNCLHVHTLAYTCGGDGCGVLL